MAGIDGPVLGSFLHCLRCIGARSRDRRQLAAIHPNLGALGSGGGFGYKYPGMHTRACGIGSKGSPGIAGYGWVTEGETLAEGVRVSTPLRGDAVLRIVEESQGTFLVVDEEQILPARDQLAQRGFYVEPTSALVWTALPQLAVDAPEPVVAILTGSGLKTPSHLV